jgi:hypothetical protein
MRKIVVAAALVALTGCQATETAGSLTMGLIRVEPHQMHADSARVVMVTPESGQMLLDPLQRGTPSAREALLRRLFPDCPDATVIEEGALRVFVGAGTRVDRAFRVICPAARLVATDIGAREWAAGAQGGASASPEACAFARGLARAQAARPPGRP